MGGGSYSYRSAVSRSTARTTMDSVEIFTQRCMNEQMAIKGKYRECCENDEHPETFPIIIGLDVTGSMGHVPNRLIKKDFPELMKKIIDAGIPCPQVCFVAFGDALDNAPIQVGQFEANDDLMEKWLTLSWLEGHGQGNGHEDPELVWYFAARHTVCDAITKRGKKGLLVTVSDEAVPDYLRKEDIESLFGDFAEDHMKTKNLLKEVQQNWNVYHLNYQDYVGKSAYTKNSWKKYLRDNVIEVDDNEDTNVSAVIADLAIKMYTNEVGSTSEFADKSDESMLL